MPTALLPLAIFRGSATRASMICSGPMWACIANSLRPLRPNFLRRQMTPIETMTRLAAEVLEPMKRAFVGKDEIIDLLGICLIGGENLFILGPPGTAKTALVHQLAA